MVTSLELRKGIEMQTFLNWLPVFLLAGNCAILAYSINRQWRGLD